MNRKILFSADTGETFEIQKNMYGYRVLQVISEIESRAVAGYYATAGELAEGLAELAIFSGDDAVAIVDFGKTFKAFTQSIQDHLEQHNECWG